MSAPSRLAAFRAQRGWSQTALAERSGIPRSSISAIEIGRLVPSVETALVLAQTLGVSVEALFAEPSTSGEGGPALAWAVDEPAQWVWTARVGDLDWRFPVEATAAGTLPPDEQLGDRGYEAITGRRLAERTLVVAGCDPFVSLLASAVAERSGVRVLPLQRSSQEALALLQSGRVHVAGLHVSDARGRGTNSSVVRQRLGAGYSLLHQVRWEEGVAVGAALRARSVEQLLRNGRWVNREPGAAARACFDRLLESRRRPSGYQHVVRSHAAVAATVSSGWADAGICVRPVASDAGLSFLSVQQADYELCIPNRLMGDPVVTSLVQAVRSDHYRRWISALPGCHTGRTGELRAVGADARPAARETSKEK